MSFFYGVNGYRPDDKLEFAAFAVGWAFYVSDGVRGGCVPPTLDYDLREWVLGFGAALADYGFPPPESLKCALIDMGVTDDEVLIELLFNAKWMIENSNEWFRWPVHLKLY